MTIKVARKIQDLPHVDVDLVDFSDITLTNGRHIDYYYDRLKTERGFSSERIRKMKKDSIWGMTFTHWDRVQFESEDPYERAVEEWKRRADLFFSQKKKAKL